MKYVVIDLEMNPIATVKTKKFLEKQDKSYQHCLEQKSR